MTNRRREYVPAEEILLEAEQTLRSRANGGIDWVTFVGSGETTLHSRLGEMIRGVKEITSLPVAVITNGSLSYLPEVRRELAAADAVLPTLDAGTADLYHKINRPHPQITFDCLVNGLTAFRQEYRGKLWVAVMLVRGLNDTPHALWDIAKVLQKIRPDTIHINIPTRPPAETWVQAPNEESLMQTVAILGNIAEVLHPADGDFDLSGCDDPIDAIITIITRHPMRQDELERTLERWSSAHVSQALMDLKTSGRAQVVERYGMQFRSETPAYYPDHDQSLRTIPAAIKEHNYVPSVDNNQKILDDAHSLLENILIEIYLKEKGYSLEQLQSLPEEETSLLMKEASTYASGKLAEVEVKAHLMQVLHEAYLGE